MKNDLTTTFLNLSLAALVCLSAGFTFLVILREPKVPAFAARAMQDNNNIMKINAILNDTATYNTSVRDPELARILQAAQQKPSAH